MLDKNLVNEILTEALSTGGDFAEVFVEHSTSSVIQTAERKVKHIGSGLDFGIGIRIFSGIFSTYAYTNVMDRENLLKTAKKAASVIKGQKQDIFFNLVKSEIENLHKIKILPRDVNKLDKVSTMHEIGEYAYQSSPLIIRADGSYLEKERQILVANSEGLWAEDKTTRSRYTLSTMAIRDNLSEEASNNFGGLRGWELFEGENHQEFAQKLVADAVSKLDAQACPSGKMTVIVDKGFGGAIFHEACGHGLEATALARKASVFIDKLGQQVANPLVSAYDDATLPNAWGSINMDDEGLPTQRKLLIENGILKNYMIDRLGGRKMGMQPNGCGRRENYRFAPTSRMSNTFIANGQSSLEEMIANTEYGLYAANMGGGSVQPASGEFNFSVDKAFIIENGKLKQQVKGAKLIGSGLDVLQNIDMVGNNLDFACGMCGSVSGRVPTTVGQPAIRVRNITVGGQK